MGKKNISATVANPCIFVKGTAKLLTTVIFILAKKTATCFNVRLLVHGGRFFIVALFDPKHTTFCLNFITLVM